MTTPSSGTELHAFMVEAYRSRASDARLPAGGDAGEGGGGGGEDGGSLIVGVIDIPADEVALFLVLASEAAAAREIVQARGLRPIRVVAATWNAAEGGAAPTPDPGDDPSGS